MKLRKTGIKPTCQTVKLVIELKQTQVRRNGENSGGATNYEILSKKIFYFKLSKRARKLYICKRRVIKISIINRCLLKNYLGSILKVSKFLRSFEVLILDLKSQTLLIMKINFPIDLRFF